MVFVSLFALKIMNLRPQNIPECVLNMYTGIAVYYYVFAWLEYQKNKF